MSGTFTNELSIDLLAQALSAVLSAQRDREVTVVFTKKESTDKEEQKCSQ